MLSYEFILKTLKLFTNSLFIVDLVMSNEYCHQVLKVCVAQICQNLGWTSTQATPLEILTDILERYLLEVGKVTHRYTEQCMYYPMVLSVEFCALN